MENYELAYKQYLEDINNYQVLNADETLKLYIEMENTGEDYYSKIIKGNIKYAMELAFKYYKYPAVKNAFEISDIIQYANIGLINATQNFEYKKNVKFTTWVYIHVKSVIIKGLKKDTLLRLPDDKHELYLKLLKEKRNNELLEIPFSMEEFAAKNNISYKKLVLIYNRMSNILYLDEKDEFNSDQRENIEKFDALKYTNGALLTENIEEIAENNFLSKDILQSLDSILTQREKYIIMARFGFFEDKKCYTLEQIGEELGLSRSRICAIQNSILKKLLRTHNFQRYKKYYQNN